MTTISPGRNVVLIGLMGAGKSSVGRGLAALLHRPFRDTDQLVEHDAGQSVAEIFAERGERVFRELEAAAVRGVSALRGQVVAVGGGAVMTTANVTHLRATGDLVLLDARPETLADRLSGAEDSELRPLLAGTGDLLARLRELHAARRDAYLAAATHTLATDALDVDQTVAKALEWVRTQPGLLSRPEVGT